MEERVINLDTNKAVFEQRNNGTLRLIKGNKDASSKLDNPRKFLMDFEDIVQTELQKSSFCIDLIHEERERHEKELHFQLTTLKELWRLVAPSKDREGRAVKKMNTIAASRQAIAECEERISVIQQRVSVLHEALCTAL